MGGNLLAAQDRGAFLMKRRMVIISEIIAPYRIPVFNALAARADIDLSVLFLAETDPGLREWRVYKDDIHFRFEVLPSWRRQFGKYNVLLNRGLSRALKKFEPEVVVCGGYNYLASWQALRWANTHHIPFLLWSESNARDLRSHASVIEFLKKHFIHSCAGFVVPGKSSLEYLRQLGVQRWPVIAAPNAVDVKFFADAGRRTQKEAAKIRKTRDLPERFFLYVGRLVPQKGVFELLEAYDKLNHDLRQTFGLVFVGDGMARRELEKRASRIDPGQIRFMGFAHREELAEFYALAEVLVLPTYSDTWGLVVNEAMSCGLPIIVTNAAGCVDDLVENNGNGYVIPPRDVGSLRNAMADLIGDSDLKKRMSQRSEEKIQAFLPEHWAQGMAEAAHAVMTRER